jgi:uncharacterized protein (DUF2235 family)
MRVLAAFAHVIGLLPPDQLNLAGYALAAYKRASSESNKKERLAARRGDAPRAGNESHPRYDEALEAAWHFSRVVGGYPVPFEFLGLWDTVASVIVPRRDTWIPDLQVLRYTRRNPSVKAVRHAISIDERRRMFRLNRWTEPQPFRPDPYRAESEVEQDIRQVWFAGVHADIGGGYPEAESALSKFPLLWIIEQAVAKGLEVDQTMVDHLVLGKKQESGQHDYVPPDILGPLHNSMNLGWWLLEWLPKSVRWREWPKRRAFLGWYLPRGEPRPMPPDARVHWSALARRDAGIGYDPVNIPAAPRVEGGHDFASPAST